ncbi:MAG TPA: GAF domain-containing protein [Burkholderiaceae bacterium]|jgi:GAF domain-containing protein
MNDVEEFLNSITTALDAHDIDVVEAAQRTAQYIQSDIGCDVVGFWILQGASGARCARRMACVDVDNPEAHLVPMELGQAECADYFELIANGGLLVSADAQNDPHLAAMREGYLIPEGIKATLCVTIAVNGESISVINCAQRSTRAWTAAEVARMQRLAAQISLRRARRRARELASTTLSEADKLKLKQSA